MKIKAILTMLIMLGGACMYALPDTADAARLGGGRSFGSRPSMSQPAQAPSAMQRQSTQQRQQAAQDPMSRHKVSPSCRLACAEGGHIITIIPQKSPYLKKKKSRRHKPSGFWCG